MLDFRIYTFLSVCKHMNFTKAASELCITQPAVSAHIHYLEKKYDVIFFTYKNKVLKLTDEGEMFLHISRAFVNDEKLFRRRLEEFSKSKNKKITFNMGSTNTISEYLIKDTLPIFLKNNPKSAVNLTVANTDILLEKLRSGDIDFALIEGSFSKNEFESLTLITESFVPVCSYNHIFKKSPKNINDLFAETLILREKGSGTRKILESMLSISGCSVYDFKDRIIISNMPSIVELVKHDIGISFLYKIAAEKEIKSRQVKTIALENISIDHDFSFVWNKNSINKDVYESFFKKFKLSIKRRGCK